MAAIEHLGRLAAFYDTKANAEADTAALGEIRFAYATDTDEIGVYINGAWTWLSASADVTLASDADALLGLTGQQITLDSQSANQVFAGPVSGGAADPAFRALVAADMGSGTNTNVLAFDNTQTQGMRWVAAPPGELLMQDGTTNPPVPLENEAGDDWLYTDAF